MARDGRFRHGGNDAGEAIAAKAAGSVGGASGSTRPAQDVLEWPGMSNCQRTACPGAHGEGGTATDPDHIVLHSHSHRDGRVKRHRWAANNGDRCADCGLNREGAGHGPYGSMRYYFDSGKGGYDYKAPPCVPLESEPA